MRLAEHDGELLHWFYDEGLVPGSEIEITVADTGSGRFAVRTNGSEHTLAEKAAAGLFVRPS